jgi:hypothetical protein
MAGEKIILELIMADFKVLSWHLPGDTEINHENLS